MMERLDEAMVAGPEGWGHVTRYRLAAGFCQRGDRVLDAACGIGYGAGIVAPWESGITYLGIDRDPPTESRGMIQFAQRDLEQWDPAAVGDWPGGQVGWDVAISFETIEHLEDPGALIAALKLARRWLICSVPVVPTVHMNPYHRHDFEPGELVDIIEDADWGLYQLLGQPQELAEIYVFQRRTAGAG